MSKSVGWMKSSLWWILGAVCAVVVGGGATARAQSTQVVANENSRAEAERLVAEYADLNGRTDDASGVRRQTILDRLKVLGQSARDAADSQKAQQEKLLSEAKKQAGEAAKSGDAEAGEKAAAAVQASQARLAAIAEAGRVNSVLINMPHQSGISANSGLLSKGEIVKNTANNQAYGPPGAWRASNNPDIKNATIVNQIVNQNVQKVKIDDSPDTKR